MKITFNYLLTYLQTSPQTRVTMCDEKLFGDIIVYNKRPTFGRMSKL